MILPNKNRTDMCANMKIPFNFTKLGHEYKITELRITTWVNYFRKRNKVNKKSLSKIAYAKCLPFINIFPYRRFPLINTRSYTIDPRNGQIIYMHANPLRCHCEYSR